MKRDKATQFLVASTLNTLQLNSTLSLPDLLLDEVVEVCLYNSCKNTATLILLAKAAVKTDEDHYVKTKNAVLIDTTLIKES